MPTVAVIGASRGIGLGLVERYAERGLAGACDHAHPA